MQNLFRILKSNFKKKNQNPNNLEYGYKGYYRGDCMPSKFQFESVCKLLASGVNNYVQIRQLVGLTSDELDDIVDNMAYYKKYFAEQDQKDKIEKLRQEKKKPWWKR